MLKILLGRTSSGKTTTILNQIKEDTKFGKKSYLCVPEQLTLAYEKKVTTYFDRPLFLCKIMSFDRFSSEIISKVGGQNADFIDEVGKLALLYKSLIQNEDIFDLYKSSIGKKGFLQKTLSLLDNLKLNDISSLSLIEASQRQDISLSLSTKLKEIAAMYDLLEESLTDKFTDNQARLKYSAEKLKNYVELQNFQIYFDSYISFTPLEMNFIHNLLVCGKDVTITLPFAKEKDSSFEIAKDTLTSLKKMTDDIGVEFQTQVLTKSYIEKNDIAFLEQNFGLDYHKKYDKPPENININLYDAPTTEINHIANTISGLIRKNNLRYSDICVAVTNLDGYSDIVRKIFSLYEIPYFLDLKRDLTSENLINLIFSLLSAFYKGLNYKNLMSILKSGFFDVEKPTIDLLDNFMVKWSISEKPYINKNYFSSEKYFAGEFEQNRGDIVDAYEKVTSIYEKHRKNFTKNCTASTFSSGLIALLNELNCKEKTEQIIENLKPIYPEIAGEMSQTWNVLVDTLSKMDTALDSQVMSPEEFQKVLSLCLDAQKISIIPPTVDSVMVIDVGSSKSIGSKILFVAGMSDTLLPSVGDTDIFFHEKEKVYLKNIKINTNSDARHLLLMEKSALYSILSSASQSIYLSYAMTDINSMSASASFYLENIKSLFQNMKETQLTTQNHLDEISFDYGTDFSKNLTFKSAIYHLFQILPEKLKQLNSDNFTIENQSEKDVSIFFNIMSFLSYMKYEDMWKKHYETVKNASFRKNEYHYLSLENTNDIYSLPLNTSISQIQKFASCPFSHFMDYLIHPQKKQSVQIDSLASGSIMHRYMEKFTKDMILQNKPLDSIDSIDDLVDKIYSEEDFLDDTSKIVLSNSKKQQNILNNLKKISAKTTDFMIKEKDAGSYKTTAAEYAIKPMRLTINLSKDEQKNHIYLHGKIDRIDTLYMDENRYIRIIDYKSSKKTIDIGEIVDGTNLQLVFYLYALENLGAGTAYSAMYLPMVNAYERTDANSLDEIEQKLKDQLKMRGLVVNDKEIYERFEKIEDDKSQFSDVSVKGDQLKGSSVVTKDQLKYIMKLVVESVSSLSNHMLKGYIEPSPIGNSCEYCNYKNICKFDYRVNGYKKRRTSKVNLKDIAKMMQKEGEDDAK